MKPVKGRALGAATALTLSVLAGLGTPAAAASSTRPLPPTTAFTPRPPDPGAVRQIDQLRARGDTTAAARLQGVVDTPQAFWLTGGTPQDVQQQVGGIDSTAVAHGTVPVLVLYDVPGRDCGSYSGGGAGSDAAYRAWVNGFVAGLGRTRAVVLVEPDGLAKLPSDCSWAYPGQDVQALSQERIADVAYAARQTEAGDPNARVYLDGGESDWQSVGTMAQRLHQAGVGGTQGFFVNVSNYQYATNSDYYGTWISDCLAYATADNSTGRAVSAGDYRNCGDQYWNGGPDNGWTGTEMSPYGIWSPAAGSASLDPAGVTSRYADELGSVQPRSHFVVDTGRDGRGPNAMSAYGTAPYDQPPTDVSGTQAGNWCNPPGAGTGPRPQADPLPSTFPQLDAYLWVKTVGESDGQCNVAGGARAWDYGAYNPWNWGPAQQQVDDPLWNRADPPAGEWFPQQALQLARNAVQPA